MRKHKVQVWIFSQETGARPWTLLLKTNAARGEFWQPVTGGVESGEEIDRAAGREVQEETGFQLDSLPQKVNYEFDYENRKGLFHETCFLVLIDGRPSPKLDPSEHLEFEWIKVESVARRLKFDSNKTGLKKALEALSSQSR